MEQLNLEWRETEVYVQFFPEYERKSRCTDP